MERVIKDGDLFTIINEKDEINSYVVTVNPPNEPAPVIVCQNVNKEKPSIRIIHAKKVI